MGPPSSASSILPLFQPQRSQLSQLVGCKYLHLSQSAACWVSWRTAMLGSCLGAHPSISDNDRPGASPSGSPVGLVTEPPFPQSLLHFCPYSSFRQEQFWVRVFDCGMATPSLTLMLCLFTGGGFYKFCLPTVGNFI